MRTVGYITEQTIKLYNYFKDILPGTELSYSKIELDTGIKMNETGKRYMRTALNKAKIEYELKWGYGIVLAEPDNVIKILNTKLIKIDNAVKKADKTNKNLVTFFSELPPHEQKQVLMVGAVFGAIRVAAENGKRLYQQKNKINNGQTIKYDMLTQ